MNKRNIVVGSLVAFMLTGSAWSIAATDAPMSGSNDSPPPNGDPDQRFLAPRTGSVRWQGRIYRLSLTVTRPEVWPAVDGFVPVETVRLVVSAADGQAVPANFPTLRLTLEHRNRFLRPTMVLQPANTLLPATSNEYTGTVDVPWSIETRMTARITFADGRRSVMTKIKNVLAIIPNPLAG